MSASRAKVGARRRAGIAALLAAPLLAAGLLASLSTSSVATAPRSTAPQTTAPGISAKECAANRAAGTLNWASPFGYTGSATILDVFAAEGLGYFKKMCLTVNLIANSYTPEALVSTDAAQITSEGSAADFLLSAANGTNLVAIATDGNASNYALLTEARYKSLQSLAGKTVAYHETIPVVISEMLAKAGVLHKVTFVQDNSYDPTLLTEGKFDALQAYRSNEPLTLKGLGLKFNEFTPASYGIKGTMDVTVVNGTFLKRYPSAAKDFLRADLAAFGYCVDHALRCLDIEQSAARAAGASFSFEHQYLEWKTESGIALSSRIPGVGIGVETVAQWEPEARALVAYGLVKHAPSLARYENTSLAASLYNGEKLIWP